MAEKKAYESPIIEIEPGEEDGGARYRLPYGIAKGLGLDTTGMTPRQVWEMLKKRGISPERAYEDLKDQAKSEIKKEEPQEVDAQQEVDLMNIENTYIRDRLKAYGVENIAVSKLDKQPSHEEIVNNLAGGDKTKGSCVSVALAYVGRSAGYDVLDFRGGKSWEAFSTSGMCKQIASLKGVNSVIQQEYNDIDNGVKLLKTMQPDKNYLMVVGHHASIVRKTNNTYEYLEMQSVDDNGFKPINTDILKYRFGCQKSHTFSGMKYKSHGMIIDCDSLSKSNDFKNMLAYINTNKNAQNKGEGGSVK